MSAQATRLESLFLLVRDGSSAQIRENAAEKLGELAATTPAACHAILQQLRPLIVDTDWEIRVAASKCINVVARSLRTESENVADQFAAVSLGSRDASCMALNLQSVDVAKVVSEGAPLLRSGGEEYQYVTNLTEDGRRVHAVKQRRLLLQRLSGSAGPIWKTREDSLTKQLLPRLNRDHAQEIADDIEASEAQPKLHDECFTKNDRKQASEMLSISTRKRRLNDTAPSEASEKRPRVDNKGTSVSSASGNDVDKQTGEPGAPTKLSAVANLVTDLFESMFDSKWEVRHGALLSLRQTLLSSHFTAAVEATRGTADSMQREFIDKWLEECLIRCICVLALDQFVDYSADGSISPVREVCAQVFGILLGSLYSANVLVGYLQVLRTLFSGSTWHACHGGLLGLKYLVQAHSTHARVLVPLIFDDVVTSFSQSNAEEEVLILTAEMLMNFSPYFNKVENTEITKAALQLWKSLKVHEKTGLVTASTVRALSVWYTQPHVAALLQSDDGVRSAVWENLSWTVPMLHHHSQSVRASSATCIAAIFSSDSTLSNDRPVEFARGFLPHLLFQLILEQEDHVQLSLIESWKVVVSDLSANGLLMTIVADQLPVWMEMLWTTDGLDYLNVGLNGSEASAIDTHFTSRAARGNVSSRVKFADAVGFVSAHVPLYNMCMSKVVQQIRDGICTSVGERQCGALLVLSKWGFFEKQLKSRQPEQQLRRVKHLQDAFGSLLTSFAGNHWQTQQPDATYEGKPIFYTEQLGSLKRVSQMESRIIDIYASVEIELKPAKRPDSASTADISRLIAEHISLFPYEKLQSYPEAYQMAHFKRQDLYLVDELVQQSYARFYHRIQGLGSSAFCALQPIPKKSGFLVKALMNSIKGEDEPAFRLISSNTIADFVVDQAHIQKKCVAKIIFNLCNSATALVGVSGGPFDELLRSSSAKDSISDSVHPDVLKKTKTRVDGAEAALREICKSAGVKLFETCRALEDAVSRAWNQQGLDDMTIQQCMHLISFLVPHVASTAFANCLDWLERLAHLVQQPFERNQTRCIVAHAIAIICKHARGSRENAMLVVYNTVFVTFSDDGATTKTETLEGAVMVLDRMVHNLGADLTPYVPSLVHFSMKTMSSQVKDVRTFAAGAFAELVPLISLRMDLELNGFHELPDSLRTIVSQNAVSRDFLESFTKGKAIQHTDVSTWLTEATALRVYQQHGVDWLCFMAKNNLHGILADDMGLGKTMQTLSAIAATLHATKKVKNKRNTMPCLVVCPPIIVHHWAKEAEKYFPGLFGSIVDYSGSASDRRALNRAGGIPLCEHGPTLIVTTYSILRSDIKHLGRVEYSFAVLDEAHLIRNPSTALFRAVLELRASHRVALSGTPLQNNVTDLWALFEFLMPGYLGDFALFRREYVLPITKSIEQNATAKQKELAAIAISQLHQKVLPFILRRTKDQVLEELPPKIITNVLLPLSPLQKRLYSLASCDTIDASSALLSSTTQKKIPETKPLTNVLTNLQLLRKICVHPALVADATITHSLNATERTALNDWKFSGKMTGLRDLLVECCDITTGDQEVNQGKASKAGNGDTNNLSPHRCLIFAHLQHTLDLTEQMLRDALPRVTYRRLDGQTPHSKRADIVQNFNADPSIDVLLLTTSVGGLGLTLTGADIVIFIEHSWNPFVDLQAMDRAHRIGQKRTVRVFRLIMEESLEEHILNLQEFKEKVAATVVQKSDARSSMNTNTRAVLSLLQSSSSAVAVKELRASIAVKAGGEDKQMAAILPQGAQELLSQLGELWDESQYDSLAFPELSGE